MKRSGCLKKAAALFLVASLAFSVLAGCGIDLNGKTESIESTQATPEEETQKKQSGQKTKKDSDNAKETTADAAKEATSVSDSDCYMIKDGGSYELSGKIDQMVVVDAGKDDVELVLADVTIENSEGPAIFVRDAGQVTITLKEGTTNTVSDGESYSITDSDSKLDAAIFSKDDLLIQGEGTLIVNGNYKHGIVGKDDLEIASGTFIITAAKDGLQCNDNLTINGGDLTLTVEDDGMHADLSLTINDGTIDIKECEEGIESAEIVINGGTISLVASDDGLNAAGGEIDNTNRTGMGMLSTSGGTLTINDGYIYINAGGDGLDANGTFTMNGGVVLVDGPENSGNGAMDYDGTAVVNGGIVIATGSSGMAMNFTEAKNQASILAATGSQRAGTSVALVDADGKAVVSFTPEKSYQCALFTAPSLKSGESYTLVIGGSVEGADAHGFAENAKISGGSSERIYDQCEPEYHELRHFRKRYGRRRNEPRRHEPRSGRLWPGSERPGRQRRHETRRKRPGWLRPGTER